jgi:hypothetical protein
VAGSWWHAATGAAGRAARDGLGLSTEAVLALAARSPAGGGLPGRRESQTVPERREQCRRAAAVAPQALTAAAFGLMIGGGAPTCARDAWILVCSSSPPRPRRRQPPAGAV